ncbi:MAG: M3 family metallopeptidase [Prevotella sp.]|nr:M3 family metallopeptidase [Prevotella sp.]
MKFSKTFFALALAAVVFQPISEMSAIENGTPQKRKVVKSKKRTAVKTTTTNTLMQKSTLPFGAPDFSKIKETDYLPAIKQEIEKQRKAIQRIAANKQKATFQNTIVAFEESGAARELVVNVFFGLVSAHKTPVIAETEKAVIPLLTDLENEVIFNKQLFERIKYVYDHERNQLKGEDKKLLEEVYKQFVRSGALLPADKMERMKQINLRISELQQQWGDMLPDATNNAVVWVNSKEELSGLSEADIAQCAKDAESRGAKAPYCIVIINTTQQPLLASLDNRDLRRRVFEASVHRADGTGRFCTYPLVSEIARLRAEQAQLMGYKNYASYSLEKTMAKNPENVYAFLRQLIAAYKPKAEAETREVEQYARRTQGEDFQLQPYDRFYYSAKMKKEMLSISDDEVKPYFNVDSVQKNGVFYAANRVYGLTFKERKDIPTYHPDMKVFEVCDKDGRPMALFYSDYFRRPTKRGGAWMSEFIQQSNLRHLKPVIYNVCNNAKAPDGQPSLLTWDEVTTMFHEFGHALHGMLANCNYSSLSGTSVARDFVEMPSQFNESFASIPEVFDHFARHTDTGQPMPEELKQRMLKSINFHSAYALGENLAATCLDMAWHMLGPDELPTADKAAEFETKALTDIGLLNPQIPPRYSTSYFNHVWGGGYAAGYYSYLWTEVLAVNIADCFSKRGPLKPEVGQDFRDKILSRGNTGDLMQMFSDFTGMASPDASALLKARGLE